MEQLAHALRATAGVSPPLPAAIGMPRFHHLEARQALIQRAHGMGPYRLLLPLGRGLLCEVYVGHVAESADMGCGHDLMIRRVLPEHAGDTHLRDLFLGGARLAAPLVHSGLPMLLDAGVHQDRPYLVTDFLPAGISLEWICQGWLLPPEAALLVVSRAAEALAHAHGRGVVHQDLHPGRILLGASGEVKVAGLATGQAVSRIIHREVDLLRRSPFLPPERWHGAPLDARANVYSLGATLHLMITGEAPDDSLDQVCRVALAARAHGELWAGLATEVERVVRRALEPAPADRYQTAGALQKDLWRILARGVIHFSGRHLSRLVQQMLRR